MTVPRLVGVLLCAIAAACGGSSSPSSPSAANGLTAPALDSPADGSAVSSYRPSLVVRNSAAASGARTYEFEIADTSSFAAAAPASRTAVVVAHTTTVAEGSGGTTTYTPDFDLQPATRLYWRARVIQGSAASEWSASRNFTTPVGGFSRPGELYDPLAGGSSIGIPGGSTTFVPAKGIRLNDGNAFVRYQLAQPLDSGEFSMEVEGLAPNGPGGKLKVFSMMDGTGDLYRSNYLLNAQYRGQNGNPDNCIAFKALFGDPFFKLETDGGARAAGIRSLDPSKTYLWRGIWGNGFRLIVQEVNGPVVYDFGMTVGDIGTTLTALYNPNPHYAYLGANNGPFGEEDGSWPGLTYRNVWIGRGPRPASLGSALEPPR